MSCEPVHNIGKFDNKEREMAGQVKPHPKSRKPATGQKNAKEMPSRDGRYDEIRIAKTRNWDIHRAATTLDGRVREISNNHAEDFTELGLIIKEVTDRELWRYVVADDGQGFCHSRDHWMNEALWCSARWGYAALSVAETCSDIPVEVRRRIPPKNLMTLRGASPKVKKDPEVQRKAMESKPSEFLKQFEADHPLQHIEAEEPYKFSPTKSQRKVIDGAMALCLALGDAGNREECLEKWAQNYVEENAYRAGEQKLVGKVRGAKVPAGMVQ